MISPRTLLGALLATVACLVAAATAAAAPLSPARYAAIDAVYVAFLPFDGEHKASSAELSAARAACGALDAGDPLLGPFRRSCNATVRSLRATDAFVECTSRRRCLRAARTAHATLGRVRVEVRATNRAIAAAGLEPACVAALRASADDLRELRLTQEVVGLTVRVIRKASPRLKRRLAQAIVALDREAADDPNPRQLHERFQAGCALPPA